MNYKNTILPAFYFPPVQFFSKYYISDALWLKSDEFFAKQSFRNRCVILGSNKLLPLVIPVKAGKSSSIMSNVIPSYEVDWHKVHIKSIRAAYGKAPFFDHYFEGICAILNKKYDSLFKLNSEIIKWVEDALGLQNAKLINKDMIQPDESIELLDLMHPKEKYQKQDERFVPKSYFQCFNIDDTSFYPNLSIIDLLMNEGPAATIVLKNSVR